MIIFNCLGSESIATALIESGADINSYDNMEYTPIYYAIVNGKHIAKLKMMY